MKKIRKKVAITLAITSMMMPAPVLALTKSETIYSTLQYDGALQKTSVTNHLSFLDAKEEVDDTTLKDILNINGEEKFRFDGEKIIWENKGHDIFYRGMSTELLPVDVSVTYYLDGKKMKPQKMLGKKGKVKIVYRFSNKDKRMVQVGKKREMLATPFAVSLGTILEGKENKDFSITNGKVISTGTRNMIVGLASPGMYENTNLEEMKSLEEIVLSYTTSHFTLANTYIVATPKFLSENEMKGLDKLEDLYQNINALEGNMQKLVDGTENIAMGTSTLYDGAKSISGNMTSIQNASSELKNGSIRLNQGLTTLKNALIQMNVNVEDKLQGKSVGEVMNNLQLLQSQNNAVIENTLQNTGKTFEELQTFYVNNQLQNYQVQGNNDPLGIIKNAYELILLLNGNNSSIDVSLSMLSSLQQVDILLSSIEQLENGSATLVQGLQTLEDGSNKLAQGTFALENGIETLMEGSNTLKNGTKAFQEQGIHKLTSYTNTMKSYQNKVEALIELSKDYKGFASSNSDTTLFVYTIPSLKK